MRHRPRKCDWGQFLGSINLGEVCLGMEALEDLLAAMSEEGFSKTDYNVMENSCNTFTEVFDQVNLSKSQSLNTPSRLWQ